MPSNRESGLRPYERVILDTTTFISWSPYSPFRNGDRFHLNSRESSSSNEQFFNMLHIVKQGCKNFPKVWEQPQNCCAKRVTWSKFYTEDPHTLGATVQNLVDTETWWPGVVTSWRKVIDQLCSPAVLTEKIVEFPLKLHSTHCWRRWCPSPFTVIIPMSRTWAIYAALIS